MRKLLVVAALCAFVAACTTASTEAGNAGSPIAATNPPAAGALIGQASYICANGLRFQALFQDNPSQVRLTNVENVVYLLPQIASASGNAYGDGVTSFTVKGKEASFSAPGIGATNCTDVTESK